MRKTVELIRAPKKRFSLPCYDKSICQIGHCKEDKIIYEREYTSMGTVKTRGTIYRSPCDLDCKMRVNLDEVPVTVCLKANCSFLINNGCQKYIQESLVHGKRTPFQFPKGMHTPSADRAFYGNKDPRTGKFV